MITYRSGSDLDLTAVADCYRACTLGGRRPIDDPAAVRAMFAAANLVFTAWEDSRIVGVVRAWTDQVSVTYLADLAVREDCQRSGIGKQLIRRVRGAAPKALLVLLAAPQAHAYYGRIGFAQHRSAWVLRPEQQLDALPPIA